jgi:1-acyl-sn-glycerol-3-phosphate acyltransferase
MIRLIVKSVAWLLFKFFYHHKVYGKENYPKGGGIIASNHCSFLDPPIIGASTPDAIHFLARQTLFRPSLFAWFLRQLNTHPVAQGKGNIQTFKTAMEILASGKKVVIFPEGRRSLTGDLQPAQTGVAMLVLRAHARIIPAYIHGAYEIYNARSRFPKMRGRTKVVWGKPLYFNMQKDLEKKEAQQQIAESIMAKIAQLKEWYLAGAKGTPP